MKRDQQQQHWDADQARPDQKRYKMRNETKLLCIQRQKEHTPKTNEKKWQGHKILNGRKKSTIIKCVQCKQQCEQKKVFNEHRIYARCSDRIQCTWIFAISISRSLFSSILFEIVACNSAKCIHNWAQMNHFTIVNFRHLLFFSFSSNFISKFPTIPNCVCPRLMQYGCLWNVQVHRMIYWMVKIALLVGTDWLWLHRIKSMRNACNLQNVYGH